MASVSELSRANDRATPRADADDEDPFADLLEHLDNQNTLRAPVDDRAALRELFGQGWTKEAERSADYVGGWPAHNFGAAYESLRIDRRPRARRPGPSGGASLWEIDELARPALPPPPTQPAAPARAASWDLPARRAADPDAWLDALDAPHISAANTEASLVGALLPQIAPPETIVVEAVETLFARPRYRLQVPVPARKRRWGRALTAAGLLLFALALLQMLLLSL